MICARLQLIYKTQPKNIRYKRTNIRTKATYKDKCSKKYIVFAEKVNARCAMYGLVQGLFREVVDGKTIVEQMLGTHNSVSTGAIDFALVIVLISMISSLTFVSQNIQNSFIERSNTELKYGRIAMCWFVIIALKNYN